LLSQNKQDKLYLFRLITNKDNKFYTTYLLKFLIILNFLKQKIKYQAKGLLVQIIVIQILMVCRRGRNRPSNLFIKQAQLIIKELINR